MNSFWSGLIDQSFCVRLTETLLLFLSEGAAIGVAAFLLTRYLRSGSSQTRYVIHTSSLVLMALCLPITFALVPSARPLEPAPPKPVQVTAQSSPSLNFSQVVVEVPIALGPSAVDATAPPEGSTDTRPSPSSLADQRPVDSNLVTAGLPGVVVESSWLERGLQATAPYAVFGYFAGVVLMFVRLVFAFYGSRRLRLNSAPVRDRQLIVRIRRQARRLGLKVIPVVAYCERIAIPVVIGAVKPMILLPAWIATGLEPDQLQAILAHEMAHIRRFDLVVNILQRVIETVLFFHPAVWYVSRRIDFERENCCDDMVVRAGHTTLKYADALVRMAELSAPRLRPQAVARLTALAVDGNNGTQLKRRVLRLLGCEGQFRLSRSDSFTLVLAGVLVLSTLVSLWHSMSSQVEAAVSVASEDEAADADSKKESKDEVSAEPQDLDELRYAGTVVDDTGAPVEGAVITLGYWRGDDLDRDSLPVATTDSKGKFEFVRTFGDFRKDAAEANVWKWAGLIAVKPGHGIATGRSQFFETTGRIAALQTEQEKNYVESLKLDQSNILRFKKDLPIRGRIVDLEGRPVVGALIEPFNADEGVAGTLDEWEAATKERGANFYSVRPKLRRLFGGDYVNGAIDHTIPPVKTGPDGTFTLAGLGSERLVSAVLSGPGIESQVIEMRSRAGDVIKLSDDDRGGLGNNRYVYYPAEFTHVAGPSQAVEGVITDLKTGKPLAGMFVRGERTATNPVGGTAGFIRATTDENGRFRLTGFPIGNNEFVIHPPVGSRYLPAGMSVKTRAALEPLVRDVKLTPGILARGVVTEADTGKPVQGYAEYFVFSDNPALNESGNFRGSDMRFRYKTNADGKFEIPVFPGSGVVVFHATDHDDFPRGQGRESIKGPSAGIGGATYAFNTEPHHLMATNCHALVQVEPAADAEHVDVAMKLTRLKRINGYVVGADGSHVKSYLLFGERAPTNWYPHETDQFTIRTYSPEAGRRVMAYVPATDSIGKVDLTGDAPKEIQVTLQPATRFVGRVIDEDGMPLAGITIDNEYNPSAMSHDEHWSGKFEPELAEFVAVPGHPIVTDSEGRFELRGVMPGLKYSARARSNEAGAGMLRPASVSGSLFDDLVAKPGERNDLGDVKVKKPKPRMAMSSPAGVTKTDEASKEPAVKGVESSAKSLLTGRVTDTDGKPVPNANLSLLSQIDRGRRSSLVRIGKADGNGEFSIELSPEQRKLADDSWAMSQVLATAPGFGPDALPILVFDSPPTPSERLTSIRSAVDRALGEGRFAGRTLKLPRQLTPVRGRLVDLEGNPLAGVRVVVQQVQDLPVDVLAEAKEKNSKAPIHKAYSARHISGRYFAGEALRELYPTVTTDAEGRFTLAGIGEGQVVSITFEGERVDAVIVHAVARDMASISLPHLDNYASGAKETYYGAEFTHVLGPAVPITGVIKDFRSGTPIANAVIRVERLFREASLNSGNLRLNVRHIQATSDAEGRYRLWGVPPGDRHVLNVTAPTTEPWLMASYEISIKPDQKEAVADIQVFKGIWIEGKVTDRDTGKPIAGHVDYMALQGNPNTPKEFGLAEDWEFDRFPIDKEGHFRTAGLPGPGILMVRNAGGTIYPKSVGASGVKGYDAKRNYLPTTPSGYPLSNWELIRPVDPPVGAQSFTLDMSLSAGQTVPGLVTTKDGQPVRELEVFGQVINNGFWASVDKSEFNVRGYDGTGPRKLFFRSKDLTLVGQLELKGPAPEKLAATVEPAVRVRGRLIETASGDAAEAYNFYCSSSTLGNFRIEEDVTSDRVGDFEIRGLIAGATYQISTANRSRFSTGKNNFQIDLTKARPGDVIDLGEVTGKNAKHAMLKSTSTGGDAMSAPKADNSVAKEETRRIVTGRVLLPGGQPAAGAQVRSSAPFPRPLKLFVSAEFKPEQFETVADNDGMFEIPVLTRPYGDAVLQGRWSDLWMSTEIVASMAGFGGAWVEYRDVASSGVTTLQLVEDRPLRGQVLDLEGRPAASATVTITRVYAAANDDLTAWTEQLKQAPVVSELMKLTPRQVEPARLGVPQEVQTDKEGRFEIRGIGKDRVVRFTVVGEDLAYSQFQAATREMEPVQVNYGDMSLKETLFGSSIRIAAQQSRPVEGVVLDAVTRKPVAGVLVESDSLAGTRIRLNRVLKTTTDAEGRFRLLGMPKGKGNAVLITPNDEQPYFQRSVAVSDPVGLEPVTVEVELHRGVWITGKITDRVTGEPAIGCPIHYLPLTSNKQVQRLPEFPAGRSLDFDQRRFLSRTDGTYRLLGYYGPAIIGIGQGQKAYPDGQGLDAITAPKMSGSAYIDTHMNPVNPGPSWPMAMKQIDVPEGVEAQTLNFTLDPGAKISFKLIDTAGQPVSGVRFNSRTGAEDRSRGDSAVREYGQLKVKPGEMHSATFFHPERQIGQVVKFSPDDVARGEMTVELQPCATVTGRLLTTTGLPLSHVSIRPHTTLLTEYGRAIEDVKTDNEGRFNATLLPGSRYMLVALVSELGESLKLASDVASEPGSTVELGNLRVASETKFSMYLSVKGPEAKAAVSMPQAEKMDAAPTRPIAESATSNDSPRIITGRVQLPDGQAATGAQVALVGLELDRRRASRDDRIQRIAISAVDRNGEFRLTPGSLAAYRYISIVAGQPGFGTAWQSLDSLPPAEAASLQLKPERLIRGRLLDTEGNPAVGVGIRVETATARESDREQAFRTSVGFAPQSPCPAFPPSVKTDATGRFVIRQIGEKSGVLLRTIENDRFGAQELAINTGIAEERGPRDATYRMQSKNPGDDQEASFVLSPAQWFEGTVRYADTHEPVRFADVSIWASQQAQFGSMISVYGKCDANGRYRICPQPGVRFGVTAYAPSGEPYLIKTTRDLKWSAGSELNIVDIELPRGLLVRGKVVNNATGEPEPNASVQYLPTDATQSRFGRDVITGWQAIQNTGDDGSFAIAVPEGEGTILVHGRKGEFILDEIGERELSRRKPGGERQYAHAIIPVTASRESENEPLRVGLKPAGKIKGRVIDESGQPVAAAAIITRLGISPTSPRWRAFDQFNVQHGQFELGGLRADRGETVHLLDREHQLGATVSLTPDDNGRTITLSPCGKATAKFVTADGKPATDNSASLMFVMTQGSPRLDLKAWSAGILSADEDFVSNVDRVNHGGGLKANEDGVITFPALIPGARYRLDTYSNGGSRSQREFVAESGKTLDLGEIQVTASDQ